MNPEHLKIIKRKNIQSFLKNLPAKAFDYSYYDKLKEEYEKVWMNYDLAETSIKHFTVQRRTMPVNAYLLMDKLKFEVKFNYNYKYEYYSFSYSKQIIYIYFHNKKFEVATLLGREFTPKEIKEMIYLANNPELLAFQ